MHAQRALGITLIFLAAVIFVVGVLSRMDCAEAFDSGTGSDKEQDPAKNVEAKQDPQKQCTNVVYVPTVDSIYEGSKALSMTSLFEPMFSLAGPHPTADDSSAIPVCEEFDLRSSLVIAAIERAISAVPKYSKAAVRVLTIEKATAYSVDEYGALVSFGFAFPSGVNGRSKARASLKSAGCNAWTVTALSEPGKDYCRDYKTKGFSCG